jgi:enoyl-CoA hydratase
LGLATHCIRADHFKEIEGALADAQPVDPLLDGLHEEPGPSELAAVADVIAAVFSADSVKQIMTRLEQQRGTSRDWAQGVLADLHQRSPLSLKVTHRAIRQAAGLDLRQVLQNDYRLAVRLLEGHDFYEGVRALLIDKDRDPRWDPAGLEQVTPAMVDACFAPLPEGDLALPTRAEMQAARV